MEATSFLRLHMEPEGPLEVGELVKALTALSHQYQEFSDSQKIPEDGKSKLLIESVAPGSIIINFVVDHQQHIGAIGIAVGVLHHAEVIQKFADRIKWLVDKFKSPVPKDGHADVTIKDCEDITNIVQPIAQNGGTQTISVVHNHIETAQIFMNQRDAKIIQNRAAQNREIIAGTVNETKTSVPLIWTQINKNSFKISGQSPDKGIIEELDKKPRPILFAEEMAPLKHELISDEGNPMQNVYFVDVEVMRVSGKIVSYKVTGYHGKDALD